MAKSKQTNPKIQKIKHIRKHNLVGECFEAKVMRSLDEVYLRATELALPFPHEHLERKVCLLLMFYLLFLLSMLIITRFSLQSDNTVKDNLDQNTKHMLFSIGLVVLC